MDIIAGPALNLILTVIKLYVWALIISVILSWLVHFRVVNTSNQFIYAVGEFLHRITEPALAPIRRALPNLGGIDLSPLALILALMFLQDVLIRFAVSMS